MLSFPNRLFSSNQPSTQPGTLTGSGPDVLKNILMVGSDLGFGIGTCGKEGQSVPVGVGQPTLRIDGITVGGNSYPYDSRNSQLILSLGLFF